MTEGNAARYICIQRDWVGYVWKSEKKNPLVRWTFGLYFIFFWSLCPCLDICFYLTCECNQLLNILPSTLPILLCFLQMFLIVDQFNKFSDHLGWKYLLWQWPSNLRVEFRVRHSLVHSVNVTTWWFSQMSSTSSWYWVLYQTSYCQRFSPPGWAVIFSPCPLARQSLLETIMNILITSPVGTVTN